MGIPQPSNALRDRLADVFSELDMTYRLIGEFSGNHSHAIDKRVCQVTEMINQWCLALININIAAECENTDIETRKKLLRDSSLSMVSTAKSIRAYLSDNGFDSSASVLAMMHIERAADRCSEFSTALCITEDLSKIQEVSLYMTTAINDMSRTAREEFLKSSVGIRYAQVVRDQLTKVS